VARHIVLLRGINVGKHRRIAMADLRELLTGHGYGDVKTLLQSGNVVLTSRRRPDALARELERQIEAGTGVDPLVVVRTREQIEDVIEHNPFTGELESGGAPKSLQVSFLTGDPDPEFVAELEGRDWGRERVAFRGREIYAWHADGLQSSELVKHLDEKRLGVSATARNWNTVLKLLELAGD